MHPPRLLLIPCAILLAACATEPGLGVQVAVDSASTSLAYFTVRNVSAGRVFPNQCNDQPRPAVDRFVNMEWVNAASDFCLLSTGPAWLEPNEAASGRTYIPGAGTYRLRLAVRTESSPSDVAEVSSRSFTVK